MRALLLSLLAITGCVPNPPIATPSVTVQAATNAPLLASNAQYYTALVQWSASPQAKSYRLYYGTKPHSYTSVVSSQYPRMRVTFQSKVMFYFAATVVSASGLESDFSAEGHYMSATGHTPLPIKQPASTAQ